MMHAARYFSRNFGLLAMGIASFLSMVGSTQASAQVGDLAKLKVYRNYYSINWASPEAHQIEVWYKKADGSGDVQWDWNNVAIQADQDLSKLTKDDFINISVFIAGWPQPPENPSPIPAELEPKRAELEAAIKRIHSDVELSDFLLVYNGYRAKIDINEYVPFFKTDDGKTWIGKEAAREYFVDFKEMKMERVSMQDSGFGLLFFGETEEQVNKLKWLDFELPQSIVGSTVLSLDFEFERPYSNQLHVDANAALVKRVLDSAVSLQAGTPVHTSLDEILAKQGDALLPVGLKQNFELEIRGFGRVGENSSVEQMQIESNFAIPLTSQNFAMSKLHAESGFEVAVSGNMLSETPYVQVVIRSPDGKMRKRKALLNLEEMKLVRSGEEVIAYAIPLKWSSQTQISFPGSGEFSKFDFYLDNEMLPMNLTGNLGQ
jgi:hypothetical protein